MIKSIAITTVLVSIAASVFLTTAHADRRRDSIYPGGYVVAESEFGNGTVRGRVRRTKLGWQVQLPGGSWTYCSKSCSDTLRVKTVDFWQSDEGMGPNNSITHDGGILGTLGITHGW